MAELIFLLLAIAVLFVMLAPIVNAILDGPRCDYCHDYKAEYTRKRGAAHDRLACQRCKDFLFSDAERFEPLTSGDSE